MSYSHSVAELSFSIAPMSVCSTAFLYRSQVCLSVNRYLLLIIRSQFRELLSEINRHSQNTTSVNAGLSRPLYPE